MQQEAAGSTGMKSIRYDPETQILRIEFESGGVYEYIGVPPEVYDELLIAGSRGWFFREFVRERYPFEKVR